jgi:hypothetical protein
MVLLDHRLSENIQRHHVLDSLVSLRMAGALIAVAEERTEVRHNHCHIFDDVWTNLYQESAQLDLYFTLAGYFRISESVGTEL